MTFIRAHLGGRECRGNLWRRGLVCRSKGNRPGNYDFYGRLVTGDPADPLSSLTLAGNTLTLVADAAASAFTDTIEHFDTFNVKWSISMDGGQGWSAVGVTKNQVYTLLDDPTTTLYHTVVHLATAPPAAGLSDPAVVVDKICSQFADNEVRRITDNELMSYSHARDAAGDPDFAFNAADMLARQDGRGQCTAWAELFANTLLAHDIVAFLTDIYPASPDPARDFIKFAVIPQAAQGTGGADYLPGTRAQGGFVFHQVVKVPLHPGRIFDPSYGSYAQAAPGTYGSDAELGAAAELVWEDANIEDFWDNNIHGWIGENALARELLFVP